MTPERLTELRLLAETAVEVLDGLGPELLECVEALEAIALGQMLGTFPSPGTCPVCQRPRVMAGVFYQVDAQAIGWACSQKCRATDLARHRTEAGR